MRRGSAVRRGLTLRLSSRQMVFLALLLLLLVSVVLRAYLDMIWGDIPTSDPYFFISWATGISSAGRLRFPGSDNPAYGSYPNGYPMILAELSKVANVSPTTASRLMPYLFGSLLLLPVFLFLRRISRSQGKALLGCALVAFAFTVVKYTSVSIPNLLGLFFFTTALWLAVEPGRLSKKHIILLFLLLPVVAKLHYLSLVCIAVALAIVVSRRVILRASGAKLEPRRIAFLLVAAAVAGAIAWTAAYKIMWGVYKIDITRQPPPRLSQATRLIGYPLIFGGVQTLLLPLGILFLAIAYYRANFKGEKNTLGVEPVLLFSLWFVFLVFASGFFNVEYYPFRFNCFLMIPFGSISLLGALLVADRLRKLRRAGSVVVPFLVLLALASLSQVSLQSYATLSRPQPLLPWEQEYGREEIHGSLPWIVENIVPSIDYAQQFDRREMLMTDWVRSRALRAMGFSDVHLHWWFFQGYDVQRRRPYPLRSLDIYTSDITHALLILGKLNLRSTSGTAGEEAYYYKYIYTSDSISRLIAEHFNMEPNVSKFDRYDGSLWYISSEDAEDNRVAFISRPRPEAFPIPPFDRLYSCSGVSIYYWTPIRP